MRGPIVVVVALSLGTGCMPPEWGARALLHPARRALATVADLPHRDIAFRSDGLRLLGWLFPARGRRRGLIVYLHGLADNRGSGLGVARRFVPLGYDVLAYDSRAHGESEGEACTYGVHERRDLSRALDAVGADRAILFGSSLGAAVALQAAADDARVRGVIAQSSFSDLETAAHERAPWIATRAEIAEAFALAEQRGRFRVGEASPVRSAARIRVPVLLIHGQRDGETPLAHSQRIYDALPGPKRLLLVPGAGHDDVLAGAEVWREIEAWVGSLPAGG